MKGWQKGLLGLGGLGVGLFLLNLVNDGCVSSIADQWAAALRNGLTAGSIYAMIALGYTMVYGVLQLINFAHSEIFMLSFVAALYAVPAFGVEESAPVGGIALVLVFTGTLVACMATSGTAAVLLERFAYRPLRKRGAPRLSFLISAIGASLFIQYLMVIMDGQHVLPYFWLPGKGFLTFGLPGWLGPTPLSINEMMDTTTAFDFFGTPFQNKRVLAILVAVVMLIVLDTFVRKTRLGRGIRAVAQDAETASMMGVNIDRVIVVTFLIGGLMAGAAGLLYHIVFGAPAFWFVGFLPGIKAFTAAVLGGIGNIRGAMLGGLTLGMVESFAVPCIGAQWKDVTAFVVLVVVLMFRPTGLLGEQAGH
ncbi:MAG TPA: branched-chain amino acid ABC transporter permease [Actinomycetota bacterium]|nr:branched-chain amino acid ABC transporter permease [Actinomycetota bacterium]